MDSLWIGIAWGLLALGVGVLVWALWWDRAGWRGRAVLRCRKCWYDLAGVGERATAEAPVVCPECGKGHGSRRAMRRTRRRWGWVVCAVVVLAASSVVRSGGHIRKRGWIAAIPETVLVLTIPLTSPEPGSSFDWSIWGNPSPDSILKRLEGRIRTTPWSERQSWFSNRVLFLIARAESHAVLTDSTTTRGSLYMHRIGQILHLDQAYGFEEDWARSVVHAEFRTRARWAPGATVHGELKIRRLIQEEYRVDFTRESAWFEARPQSDGMYGGGGLAGGPVIGSVEEYIELDQWDGLSRIVRKRRGDSAGELMIGRGEIRAGASGPQSETVWVDVYDRSGHPQLGLVWTRVARRTIPFGYVVDPDAGPEIVQDPGLGARIGAGLSARLGVRFDAASERWELFATLADHGVEVSEPITIGGRVSIVSRKHDGTVDIHRNLLWGSSKWWRLLPTDQQNSESVGLVGAEHSDGTVSFEETGSLTRVVDADAPLMLVISGGSRGPAPIVFADPEAERVFGGRIVVPIRDWTVGELNRYRLHGTVPDHAIPEGRTR